MKNRDIGTPLDTLVGVLVAAASTTITAIVFSIMVAGVALADETDLNAIYYSEQFEGYPAGTDIEILGYEAAGNTTIEPTMDKGDMGGQTWQRPGHSGWGEFGWMISSGFPAGITDGAEFWWRTSLYFPEDFNPKTDTGRLKVFRMCRNRIIDGKQKGCLDILMTENFKWSVGMEYAWEGNLPPGEDYWVEFDGPFAAATPGQWHTFEIYVKLSNNHDGIIRMWRDGLLIGEIDNRPTNQSGDAYTNLKFFTYWNGEPDLPRGIEGMHFDDVAIAANGGGRNDGTHLATDLRGRKLIGMAGTDGSTPPPIDPPPIDPPIDPPPIDPPVEPPIDPPPGPATDVHLDVDDTTVDVSDRAVTIDTDLPVIVDGERVSP